MLSSTVTDALTLMDNEDTTATITFLRMMDALIDCMNVHNVTGHETRRKENRRPYRSPNDERFKVQCGMHALELMYTLVLLTVAQRNIPWLL